MKLYDVSDAKARRVVWQFGEKVRFTGKTEVIYGGLFAGAIVLETGKFLSIAICELGERCTE